MNPSKNKRIVIIGGVAAGTKTAAKARRQDPQAEIVLFTDEEYISYAGCGEPYYVSGDIPKREMLLARTPEQFEELMGIRIFTLHRVSRIDPEKKNIEVKDLRNGAARLESFDALVIATGASPIVPPIPGVQLRGVFTLRTVPDAEDIRERIDSGAVKRAVVVGGGFIGLEMAESFVRRGVHVTVIERLPQLAPPYDAEVASMLLIEARSKGIRVLLNTTLEEILDDEKKNVRAVKAGGEEIPADLVLLSVGARPNTRLAQDAGIELGPTGAIRVNNRLQTNYPFIYAAGDCTETTHIVTGKPVWIPLGSTANRQGRVLAINITGGDAVFPGVLGTGIFRLFDLNAAKTGLSEREAKNEGFDFETVIVPVSDRPHYMPGGKNVTVKLIAERGGGRVLGAQSWGQGDVSKVIDTLAAAISFKATVDDLTQLDLAYAPPFAPPLGNAAVAANVMQNKLQGATEGISPLEVKEKLDRNEDFIFLDVRNPKELKMLCTEKTVNIPLPRLAACYGELSRDKEIVTSCGVGLRAASAYRLLKNKGYKNVRYMDGGIMSWPHPVPGPAKR
ncbi:MAG: FAD-dependent oxidoreductase [Candidatus Omnitrophota bacterium]